MLKSIKVGDLRQNPTAMLDDVQHGEEYVVTNHGREVARIVPIADDTRWVRNRDRVIEVLVSFTNPELAELIEEDRRAEVGVDL